jgi:hypothetical protein
MPTQYNRSVMDWLRRSGVKTPYSDLTEAQIEEKNKANPLGGYGFMSAQDKAMRAQQNAMMERQMKQEQEMMQQQLLARMSSQQQIGHHVGAGVGGLIGMLKGKGQAPQEQGPPQDDPEVARYNQLLQEGLPEDVAMEMLGNESGNGAMIRDAQAKRMERQKSTLEMEDLQGKVSDRKNKKNEVITTQFSGPDGEPMQRSLEIIGKDGDGNNIYRELGKAIKGSVVDTKEGYGLTGSQGGKQITDFEGAMTNAENYLDVSDRMLDIADKAEMGPGFAMTLAAEANNLRFGFKGIKDIIGNKLDAKTKAKLSAEDPVAQYKSTFDSIQQAAGWDANLKALLLEQAYLKATANGQRATDKDIDLALKTLGGSLNDPKIFKDVLMQDREITVDRLMNSSQNKGGADKTLADVYPDRLRGIQGRRSPKAKADKDMARLEELRRKHKGKK